MSIIELLNDHSRVEKIKNKLSMPKENVESFLRTFGNDLESSVKKTICCLGIEQIDEEAEKKVVGEKLLVLIGKAIPSPYSIAWPILKPVVREIVLALIETAANEGEEYCKGVVCTIIPLPIDM